MFASACERGSAFLPRLRPQCRQYRQRSAPGDAGEERRGYRGAALPEGGCAGGQAIAGAGRPPRVGRILRDTWEQKKRLPAASRTRASTASTSGRLPGRDRRQGNERRRRRLPSDSTANRIAGGRLRRDGALGLYRMDFQFDMGGAKVLANSVSHGQYADLPTGLRASAYV